jgi:hypothetical protein
MLAPWLAADPDFNVQFRRRWTDPPWPKRKSRPLPGATLFEKPITSAFQYSSHVSDGKARTHARAMAKALFSKAMP